MSAAHDPAICELLSFFDTEHLPAHLAEAARPFCAAARALAAGDVGPVLDLAEPGGRERLGSRECCAADVKLLMARDMLRSGRAAISGPAPVMRLLLEAKDCAVRAVLVVQRSMGPEVVEQLAQVPQGCESLGGHPPDLEGLRELGALEPAGVDEQPDPDGIVEARITPLGHVMVRIARSLRGSAAKGEPETRDLETELLMFADRIDSAARHPSCGVTPRTWILEDLARLREIAKVITSKGAAGILARVHAALNRAGVPGVRSEADRRVDALAVRAGATAGPRGHAIAKAIADDIDGRSGLKKEWRAIDDDIRAEILEEWARIADSLPG